MIDVERKILHLDQQVMGTKAKARGYDLIWAIQVRPAPMGMSFGRFFYISGIDFGHFGHKSGLAFCTLVLN